MGQGGIGVVARTLTLIEHYEDSQNARKSFAGRYFCYHLIYYEYYTDVYAAIGREKEIKGWKRDKKEALISSFNPDWRFLESITEQEKGDLPVWHVGEEPLSRREVVQLLLAKGKQE